MIKASVIIPVYNVEEYLTECLDSVVNQSLKELEIICIDDCSTDGSYNILLDYAKKDNRFKVLKTDVNSGQAIVRNSGIKKAIGEYIYFMDPDDYIDLDYIENLYNTAKKYDSDITSNLNIMKVINKNISYYNNDFVKSLRDNSYEGISNISIKDEKINTKEFLFVTVWNKIIRRSFLIDNNLFFLGLRARAEDVDLYYRYLAHNPKTSYNHKSKYYYRMHNTSTIKISNSNIEYNIKAIGHLYNTINYYKKMGLIDCMPYVYYKCWLEINHLYAESNYSTEFYPYIHKFTKDIKLDTNVTKNIIGYDRYLLIKGHSDYNSYLKYKFISDKINLLENKLNYNNNWVGLFGINLDKDYIILVILGIKFSIKIKK